MGVNSKEKGGRYERDISRKLSEWIRGNDKELIVWRTSGSGSVSTIAKKSGKSAKNLDGDFQYIGDDLGEKKLFNKYFFDSKSLGDVHLMLINPKNQKSNQLLKEWKKVYGDAETSNKIPIMIVKATNDRKLPDFMMIPLIDELFNLIGGEKIAYTFEGDNSKYNCFLVSQDNFFGSIKYEQLM